MNGDEEHLRLLSIFHYVMSGITALPIIYLVIVLMLLLNPRQLASMGWMFIAMTSLYIIFGLALAVCMLLAGRNLVRRTNYTFCLVVAAVECVFMPFGTALGVFSLIVLTRDTVKPLFLG